MKLTFLCLHKQLVFKESLENLGDMELMLRDVMGEDDDIVTISGVKLNHREGQNFKLGLRRGLNRVIFE